MFKIFCILERICLKTKKKIFRKKTVGFSLIEVMVGVAVFVIFAVGIYSGLQFVFKVVYQSRLRILETGILNEQAEMIRNMSFYDVGIVDGSPSGILERVTTTTRNNTDFTITRTIRNIDNSFDGLAGGDPNDIAPADYKMVELEIICNNCGQREPIKFSTYIAPKFLEGDPDHGALFIEVFDANADPVQGADVYVQSDEVDPVVDFVDTTDNNGMLKLLDLTEGFGVYNIEVSKSGFTTDLTTAVSEIIFNPVKPPASVIAQDVTEISFSIDEVSQINLNTINNYCLAISGVPVNIYGTKLIATDPVLKVNENINTNSSGNYIFSNMEWDDYVFQVSNYDLIGTIPALPLTLLPGSSQDVKLILGSDTTNSLLVNVQDGINDQSLSNTSVRIYADSYDETQTTGVGFVRQTDWSAGSGQLNFDIENKYWVDDGGVEVSDPGGDIKLKILGDEYVLDGQLESSVFDLGTEVSFVNLVWEPIAQPTETGENSVLWQVATSNTSTPETWNYLGPDGTSGTFYNSENIQIADIHDGDRYFRYKLFLSTQSIDYTPTISDISIGYTTGCTPPGQVYFGNLDTGDYTVEVSRTGYQDKTESITVDGDMIFSIDMVSN